MTYSKEWYMKNNLLFPYSHSFTTSQPHFPTLTPHFPTLTASLPHSLTSSLLSQRHFFPTLTASLLPYSQPHFFPTLTPHFFPTLTASLLPYSHNLTTSHPHHFMYQAPPPTFTAPFFPS